MVKAWVDWASTQEVVEHLSEKQVEADCGMPQMDDKWVRIPRVASEKLKGLWVSLIFVDFFFLLFRLVFQ